MSDVVELSRSMYEPYLDDQARRDLEGMDEADRAYFWTYLYHEMPNYLRRSMLEEAERLIAGREKGRREEDVPKPFSLAEERIAPHAFMDPQRLMRR